MKKIGWFNRARYGMFIHWGAYSVAGRGEWIMNRELIPAEEYRRLYAERFTASHYDPADWAAKAKKWGMGYTVLTTRHHDGFALWDSEVNPYNAAKLGPKRDLVAPYVEAVRKAGLKVGLYYSPANWSCPDYPGGYFRDWPDEKDWAGEEARRRFIEYYRAELKELLTEYGKIDYLWFDGCIPGNIDGDETIAMIREWQPEIILNNRLGNPFDVKVCEQTVNPPAEDRDWEACMTLNDNWGWHAGDFHWKSAGQVIQLLLTCAEKGGNLLLNVGPKEDGTIPEESVRILDEAGEWLERHREAVTQSERHPFSWNCTARPVTVRGSRIFLHFLNDPCGEFCWAELKNEVRRARLFPEGGEVSFRQEGARLFLGRPEGAEVPYTVELEVEGKPEAVRSQTTFWIPE
ncbi:alpha-L-fucosidase [Victivallis vadensis]|uniref:alpha-L-fucosidase n=1 Tax=Victivallis vadensis TaxID=172901 RepID=UPI00307E944E